ncbi:MAG: DsbC family protein [Burkholderiales bacterium]|nr:DsbC family protein [Burkholderiales bacterium]
MPAPTLARVRSFALAAFTVVAALGAVSGVGAQAPAPATQSASVVAPAAVGLPAAAPASVADAIRKSLTPRLNGGATIDAVSTTAVPGLYEVRIAGTDVLYMDATGNFAVQGALIDVRTGQNVTQERVAAFQAEAARINMPMLWSSETLAGAVTLVKGNGARKMVVFEDPYCGYCKKLRESFEAMDNITVYTLMTTNLTPNSGKTARDLWCAADRTRAYDDWMVRNKAPASATANCADPLGKIADVARKMGVGPVPAVFFADGSRSPGYLPAKDLEARLAALTPQFGL